MSTKNHAAAAIGKLGAFAGVFTPSVLTILGIILFLRLGYVVGSVGLAAALLIIGLSNGISVLTSISLAAIATNLKVKGGGDYYLISRTLGVEFGGSIGVVLFLAQSVSIAFYCLGFGEVVHGMLPLGFRPPVQVIAALAVGLLFILAWLGADWATKFQYLVMATLAAALFSFFAGGLPQMSGGLILANLTAPAASPPFWVVFAIFFPAVTGFTQGVSMSGDLADPGKSLPLGTFLAVGVSIVVYFGVALVFAAALPNQVLATDYNAMNKVAAWAPLIDAGVIAATLSSAMASFMGAPRILQSLARDKVSPFLNPFAKGAGAYDNPRRGVLLSMGIALAAVGAGSVNIIAPVVSMFFLISYGLLNYATFFEARAASPAFRPRFKYFHWRLSALGALACGGAMLALNLPAGAAAIALLIVIYHYIGRTTGPARWADSRRGHHLQRAREHLIAAAGEVEHSRDWRPQVLAFSRDPQRRQRLTQFASWVEGGSGLTTLVKVLESKGVRQAADRDKALAELRREIEERELDAFPLVVAAEDPDLALKVLVQSAGLGPIRGNLMLLNTPELLPAGEPEDQRQARYGQNLLSAFRLGLNVLLLHGAELQWAGLAQKKSTKRSIHVWWWGGPAGRLSLLLAHLMTRHDDWRGAAIRVFTWEEAEGSEETLTELRGFLEDARIDAEPELVTAPGVDGIALVSEKADMVFLPFRVRGNLLTDPYGDPVSEMLSRLPITALVMAAQDLDLEAEPDEGPLGRLAELRDAYSGALKRAGEAEKEREALVAEVEKLIADLQENEPGEERDEYLKRVRGAMEAKDQVIRAERRAAKAKARVEMCRRELVAAGGAAPEWENKPGSAGKGSPGTPELAPD